MKFAIVGYGRWGKILEKKLDELGFKVCLRIAEHKRLDDHNRVLSWDEICENSFQEIDAVFITVPIDLQHKYAKYFLQLRKHVFLEKPGCTSYEKLKECYEIAEKNQVILHVDYLQMYNHVNKDVIEYINAANINYISCKQTWSKHTNTVDWINNLACHEVSRVVSIANNVIPKIDTCKMSVDKFVLNTTSNDCKADYVVSFNDTHFIISQHFLRQNSSQSKNEVQYLMSGAKFDIADKNDMLKISIENFLNACCTMKYHVDNKKVSLITRQILDSVIK